MANKIRVAKLAGIEEGSIDPKNRYVVFKAKIDPDQEQYFAAKANVIEQVLSTLATLLRQLREYGLAPASETVSAIEISQYAVRKDPFSDKVLMQIISVEGIPYTFAIPAQATDEISERLKAEGSMPTTFGKA